MSISPQNILYLLSLILLITYSLLNPLNSDEAEHIHFAWLNSHGYRPYVDYWQHHMPLAWDLLAPLFIIDNNSLVTMLIRLILVVSIAFCTTQTLNKLGIKNHIWSAIFVLSLIFPLSRLEIRPELLVFPIYCYFFFFFSKKNQSFELDFKTIILLTLAFLLTLRVLPVIIVYVIGYCINFKKKDVWSEVKKWLFIVLPILALLHTIYDIRDLFFFVVVQSSNYFFPDFLEGSYFLSKFSFFSKTYTIVAVFFLNTVLYSFVIKKNGFLILLSFLQILLCLVESGPYAPQATFLLSFLNLVFLTQIILYYNFTKLGTSICLLLFIPCVGETLKVSHTEILLEQLSTYTNKISSCGKNSKTQTSSFSRLSTDNSQVHPLFVFDSTYFGFYQDKILTKQGIQNVLFYNEKRSRSIKYVLDEPPTCLGDITKYYEIKLFSLE